MLGWFAFLKIFTVQLGKLGCTVKAWALGLDQWALAWARARARSNSNIQWPLDIHYFLLMIDRMVSKSTILDFQKIISQLAEKDAVEWNKA